MEEYRRTVIQQVKNYPLLWDPHVEAYSNKQERKRVWSLIDAALRPPSGIRTNAKHIWEHLMRGYANALKRKEQRIMRTGFAPPGMEWKFEKAMSFLVPVKTHRAIITGSKDRLMATLQNDNSSETATQPYDSSLGAVKDEPEQSYDSDVELIYDEMDDEIIEDNDTDTEGVTAKEELENMKDPENEAAVRLLPDTAYQYTVLPEDNEINSRHSGRSKTLKPNANICSSSTSTLNVVKRKRQLDDMVGSSRLASKLDDETTSKSTRYAFFQSLMPVINKLSDDSFLDFQTDVIQSLKSHRNADETLSKE